jgi:hypothetical protein
LIGENDTARYRVRLSVPRVGGMRAWGSAAGDFERRLVAHPPVIVSPTDRYLEPSLSMPRLTRTSAALTCS